MWLPGTRSQIHYCKFVGGRLCRKRSELRIVRNNCCNFSASELRNREKCRILHSIEASLCNARSHVVPSSRADSSPAHCCRARSSVAEQAAAAALPPLDPNDPTAKALGFVNDATKVDSKTHPTFKPGQNAALARNIRARPGDATAACTIFAGKSVPQGGWCQVWAQKG